MRQNKHFSLLSPFHLAATVILITLCAESVGGDVMLLKTEHFDTDPGWDGRNNRANDPSPRQIVQNFGFSAASTNAGGTGGEIGGFITPAGEPAYYAAAIEPKTLDDTLFAAGMLNVPQGGGHTLIGFFNSDTVNEWRTPNTLALRIYGRGTHFLAYNEYGTSKWRAGGNALGGEAPIPTGNTDYPFSLNYDPNGAGGLGTFTATVGSQTAVLTLEPGHKADGATFNRFGILNVVKSADDAGRIWLDNLSINGQLHEFNTDPGWDGLNNRRTYNSTNVRPRFDFGYSEATNHAGGAAPGEVGGHTFRGDSRLEFNGRRLAYYGDRLQETLSLDQPLHAEGTVALHRGVSDSTTLIGFFHAADSVRSSDSQASATPENFLGAAIEGPSAEGFYFYPVYGLDQEGEDSSGRGTPTPPFIYPDGASRRWTLDYDPLANEGRGRIVLTLDGQSVSLNLENGHKQIGAHFNRFGIITTHIDGNGQTAYFDDLTYTIGTVPEPQTAAMVDLIAAVCGVARPRDKRQCLRSASRR